jgi:hypothetical protein
MSKRSAACDNSPAGPTRLCRRPLSQPAAIPTHVDDVAAGSRSAGRARFGLLEIPTASPSLYLPGGIYETGPKRAHKGITGGDAFAAGILLTSVSACL